MRFVSVVCMLLLLCGIAAAQATIIGGTASNWAPAYGVYAAPFVPLVTTPSITLSVVSPSATGASNATFGLVAGATNATLSSEFVAAEPPVGVYTQPVWYGGAAPLQFAPPRMPEHRMAQREQAFDFIASGSVSVAQLMSGARPAVKASRTYTNEDVDRVNQTNGMVKYRGKTEHI